MLVLRIAKALASSTLPGALGLGLLLVGAERLAHAQVPRAQPRLACSGISDDAPALIQLINEARRTGKTTVHISGPVCAIASTIVVPIWSNIRLVGGGAGDGGRSTTKLKWIGAEGGTMVDLTSAGDGYFSSGLTLKGVELDAAKHAGTCLLSRTLTNSKIDVICDDPTRVGIDLDVSNSGGLVNGTVANDIAVKVNFTADAQATGTVTLGSNSVVLLGPADGIAVGQYLTGNGIPYRARVVSRSGRTITFQAPSGSGALYGSPSSRLAFYDNLATGVLIGRGQGVVHTGDVNSNIFRRIIVNPGAGDAVVCGAADGNLFEHIETTGQPGSGTTGPVPGPTVALRLQGSTSTDGPTAEGEACHHNKFLLTELSGRLVIENGVLLEGTNQNSYPAQRNTVGGLGTGDSFTFIDAGNTTGTSSDARGDGTENDLNVITTDEGSRVGGSLAGINLSSISPRYRQSGFSGNLVAASCGRVARGGDNAFVVTTAPQTLATCTITFPHVLAVEPICLVNAYSANDGVAVPVTASQVSTGSHRTASLTFARNLGKGAIYGHCF